MSVTEYVCDCGGTRVTVEAPATYPFSENIAQAQCNVCGTYVKDYPAPTTSDCRQAVAPKASDCACSRPSVEALEAERDEARQTAAEHVEVLTRDLLDAEAGRDQAIKERDEWKELALTNAEEVKAWRARDPLATEAALNEARAALYEYGHHKSYCRVLFGTRDKRNPCTCGLAALAGVPGGGQEAEQEGHAR